MSECMIVRRGGGAKDAFAYIAVNYPVGSTCTATNGVRTLTAKDTSGKFVFNIPNSGTFPQNWTVSESTNNNSKTVSVSGEHAWVAVDLVDTYEKLAADIAQTDFARLSMSVGDTETYDTNRKILTRVSSEPIILMFGTSNNNNTNGIMSYAFISLNPVMSGCYFTQSMLASGWTTRSHYTPNGTQYYVYYTSTNPNNGAYSITIDGVVSLSGISNSTTKFATGRTYIWFNSSDPNGGELTGDDVSTVESWIDRLALLSQEESTVLYNGEPSSDIFEIAPISPVSIASKYNANYGGFAIVSSATTGSVNTAFSVNKIDLTNYSKLRVTHTDTVDGTSSTMFFVGACSQTTVASAIAATHTSISQKKQTIEAVITNVNEEAYIIISIAGSNNTSYIQKIELIK